MPEFDVTVTFVVHYEETFHVTSPDEAAAGECALATLGDLAYVPSGADLVGLVDMYVSYVEEIG